MQITSTVSQRKMEPLNGNPNNSAGSEPITQDDAEQVGGAFCHQFYITVSENRGAIDRFYGHESIFQLDDKVVTGSGEIAKQYDRLPESTHFKIHSIRGLPTLHKQGVLVHVIGTVNLRPFVQTFVLGQQGQKKYYIEIDNFQYIDSFFENKTDSEKPATTTAVNGHSNGVNGKVTKPAAKAPEPTPEPVPLKQQTPQKPPQQTPKKAEEPRPAKQETPKSAEKENKAPKQHQQQQHQPQQHQQAPAPAPIPEPAQVPVQINEAPKPKTWANLVRQGGNQQPPQQPNYNQIHQQQMHQQHMQAAAMLQQQAAHQAIYQQAQAQRARAEHAAAIQHLQQPAGEQQQQQQQQQQGGEDAASLLERKIYLGGITREIVPSNTAQAETEIKQVFYKYGEVEEVRMPRKVLDSPNDTSKHAFAFITMRTKQGVQAIFNMATRDEAGVWKLPLKLDAFGFDGLAQISEQRDQPPGGGFRGGRGGGGGGGFGNRGFYRRGNSGGAPRGGMQRGPFQNNSMNNGH